VKPKDLLLLRLREHIVEPLAAHGFRFTASKLHLSRTVGHAKHHIGICSNRYNREDDVEFWTMWSVRSLSYPKWYAETWGEPTSWDLMADSADWNIPGWARGPAAQRFQLRNIAEDAREMAEFRESFLGAGLDYLERVSTWEGAAEALRVHRWGFDRAADFLMIAGQRERAREVLLEGLDTFVRQGRQDALNEVPGLRARLARYFPDGPAPSGEDVHPSEGSTPTQ
jgi:hypothetical protein